MKKQTALISVAAILFMSGCSGNDAPVSANSTIEASAEPAITTSQEETAEPVEIPAPLFRESSLYFERMTSADAESSYTAAASSKKPKSAKELGLTQVYSDKASGRYEYKIENVQTNAFVDFRSEDDVSVIIDPAYMYNIPLPTLEMVPAGNYIFDINGSKVVCDSLFVKANSAIPKETEESGETQTDYRTDGYCYAAVTMDIHITAYPDRIEVTGKITHMEKLTKAETALDVCLLGDDAFDEKSEAAAETYRALLSIKDKLLGDDIMGINLIDLDFDGMPEVLVSRGEKIDDTAKWKQCSDVDIYCIKNSGLEFIDTLYNNDSGLLSDHGNDIIPLE